MFDGVIIIQLDELIVQDLDLGVDRFQRRAV